ncbi:MAG: response regulator [Thermotogaceae bacterium]|nr:response regulator [Thermotogaceae bacterium]
MDLKELFFKEFKDKVSVIQKSLTELLENPSSKKSVEEVFRAFHTLKGSSGLVGFENFQKIFHRLEDYLREWKETSVDPVVATRISEVVDYISSKEKDLTEEDMKDIEDILEGRKRVKRQYQSVKFSEDLKSFLEKAMDGLVELESSIISGDKASVSYNLMSLKSLFFDFYEKIVYISMQEIVEGFDRYVLMDATELGKKAKLILEIDSHARVTRKHAGVLRDSLIHLIRNAVVHGIELPEERKENGKNETGTVIVKAWIDSETLHVIVEDDGKGIDADKILEKAKNMSIEEMDPSKIIFMSQFSTLDEVSSKGGRGVGLNAVKSAIETMNGEIEVSSQKGRGTKFHIRLPVERYLKKILVVKRGEKIFGINLTDVEEVISNPEVFELNGKIYVNVGNKNYVVKDFNTEEFKKAIITKNSVIAIDEVIGIRETTVKSSFVEISSIKGFAFGLYRHPLPIVDPSTMPLKGKENVIRKRVLIVDDSPLTRVVLKRAVEKLGYETIEGSSFEEGKRLIEKEKLDFALLDINLPDGNGIDLLKIVKSKNKDVKVAMLTAEDYDVYYPKAKEYGADEFIQKGQAIESLIRFLED